MDHVIKEYEAELVRLRSMVAEMGNLTGEQLDGVLEAAEGSDANAAARIVEREPQADRLELQIDHHVIRLLATRQPVAVDLREILSALRIANELERICDHAEDMARRVIALGMTPIEPLRSLVNLGRFATTMVKDAMLAYAAADVDKAQQVWDRDEELDEMYAALFRELLAAMMENPHRITATTHLLLMAGDIQRAGDRATNIAEMVHYRVIGAAMEEERPKGDASQVMMISTTS